MIFDQSDVILAAVLGLLFLLAIHLHRSRSPPGNRGRCQSLFRPSTPRSTAVLPPKPAWVEKEVLRLKAVMPDAGCRTISAEFNRLHMKRGMTISKSWVAKMLKKNADKILELRREIRKRKPRKLPKNIVWALDLTALSAAGKPILGMIDHGTRACMAFRELHCNSSIAILRLLLDAIELYGSTFTSRLFRFALFWLGIRHQRTEPMAPWQTAGSNGSSGPSRKESALGSPKEETSQSSIRNSTFSGAGTTTSVHIKISKA